MYHAHKRRNRVAYIKIPITEQNQVSTTSSSSLPAEIVQDDLTTMNDQTESNTSLISSVKESPQTEKQTTKKQKKERFKLKRKNKIEGNNVPTPVRLEIESQTTLLSLITKPTIPITVENIKEGLFSIDLDPVNVRAWSREDVLSVLFQECKLCKLDIVKLYNEGFSEIVLNYLITAKLDLDEKEKLAKLNFPRVSPTLFMLIIGWIDKKLYHLWDKDKVEKYLRLFGVIGKDLEQFIGLDGYDLIPMVHRVWDNSYVNGEFSSSFINWANSTKCIFKPLFNLIQNSSKISERIIQLGLEVHYENQLKFVQSLLLWLPQFETSILEFEDRVKIEFNEKMKSLNLDIEETSRFIYSGSEESPPNNYKQIEDYLGFNKVLTFVEIPETGKTHVVDYLSSTNRCVTPLGYEHINHLYERLCGVSGDVFEKRNLLNIHTKEFSQFYQRIAYLLFKYAILFMRDSNIEMSSVKIKQHIFRYLANEGSAWIGKQEFNYCYILPECEIDVVWLLDKVQEIDTMYPLKVPRNDTSEVWGTMLTLLVSSLRKNGDGVVLMTQFLGLVAGNIEMVRAKDTGKRDLEAYIDFKLLSESKSSKWGTLLLKRNHYLKNNQ